MASAFPSAKPGTIKTLFVPLTLLFAESENDTSQVLFNANLYSYFPGAMVNVPDHIPAVSSFLSSQSDESCFQPFIPPGTVTDAASPVFSTGTRKVTSRPFTSGLTYPASLYSIRVSDLSASLYHFMPPFPSLK